MTSRLAPLFEACGAEHRAALVGYLPAGYPTVEGSRATRRKSSVISSIPTTTIANKTRTGTPASTTGFSKGPSTSCGLPSSCPAGRPSAHRYRYQTRTCIVIVRGIGVSSVPAGFEQLGRRGVTAHNQQLVLDASPVQNVLPVPAVATSLVASGMDVLRGRLSRPHSLGTATRPGCSAAGQRGCDAPTDPESTARSHHPSPPESRGPHGANAPNHHAGRCVSREGSCFDS